MTQFVQYSIAVGSSLLVIAGATWTWIWEVLLKSENVIALAALFIAWSESRRNSRVVIRMEESEAYCSKRHDGIVYCGFKIRIKNLGISLFDPRLALVIRVPRDGWSENSIGLKRLKNQSSPSFETLQRELDGVPNNDEFARGMTAEFGFEFPEGSLVTPDHSFFELLPTSEDAVFSIEVRSQGFVAKVLSAKRPFETWRNRWNGFAEYVRFKIPPRRSMSVRGGEIVTYSKFPPAMKVGFDCDARTLMQYIEREAEKPSG